MQLGLTRFSEQVASLMILVRLRWYMNESRQVTVHSKKWNHVEYVKF